MDQRNNQVRVGNEKSLQRDASRVLKLQLPEINNNSVQSQYKNLGQVGSLKSQRSKASLSPSQLMSNQPASLHGKDVNSLKHYYEILDKQRKRSIEKIQADL